MKRSTAAAILLMCLAVLVTGVLIGHRHPDPLDVSAAPLGVPWPGERELWAGDVITQTPQSRSINMMGANTHRYLFYRVVPAYTDTVTITVRGQWQGNVFTEWANQIDTTKGVTVTDFYTLTNLLFLPTYSISTCVMTDEVTLTLSVVGE